MISMRKTSLVLWGGCVYCFVVSRSIWRDDMYSHRFVIHPEGTRCLYSS